MELAGDRLASRMNKKGLRHIRISLELIGEILRGQRELVEAINVPADMTVIGSVSGPGAPDHIVLLCGSDEWEGVTDNRGQMLEFLPEYRRIE